MDDDDRELLEREGWNVDCERPFELSTKDGSRATGEAAHIVLLSLQEDYCKTIYYVECCSNTFFLDEEGHVYQWFHENDAQYRSEYMNPLFRNLGIRMLPGLASDKRFKTAIKNELKAQGFSADEIKAATR